MFFFSFPEILQFS